MLDNGLTINDCRFAAETGSGTDDRGIAVAPIVSIAGEDACLPSLNHHLRTVAIVFDFVNPVLAFGRLIDRSSWAFLSSRSPASVSHVLARLA